MLLLWKVRLDMTAFKTTSLNSSSFGADIIEEIISEEIVDETDVYEDMHTKRRAKRQSTAAVMRGIVERQERMLRRDSNGTMAGSYPGTASIPSTPGFAPAPRSDAGDETTRLLSPIEEHNSSSNNSTPKGTWAENTKRLGTGNGNGYGAIPISESPKESD